MPKYATKIVIAVKTETTQGSAVSPAATDFLLAEDVKLKPVIEWSKRDPGRSYLGPIASLAGSRHYEITFKTELKGSGTAGTIYAPLDALIQACGFTSTATPVVSVVYAPTNSAASANYYGPGKSCTIEVYMDGVKHIMAGCVGNAKFPMEAGKICMVEFTMKGVYAAPTDTAAGTQTYLSALPPIVQSATFTMQTLAAYISKLEIDTGNEVAMRSDVNSAAGIKGFMITKKLPVGSVDPEMESVATHDFFAKLLAGTEGTVGITVGSATGNIITFSATKTQYTGLDYGDRNGLLTLATNLQFNENDSTNWITITMT
jgi:hypothetical protein